MTTPKPTDNEMDAYALVRAAREELQREVERLANLCGELEQANKRIEDCREADSAVLERDLQRTSAVDDPLLDGTDGAHPAWWRGHDRAVGEWKERALRAERRVEHWRHVGDIVHAARNIVDVLASTHYVVVEPGYASHRLLPAKLFTDARMLKERLSTVLSASTESSGTADKALADYDANKPAEPTDEQPRISVEPGDWWGRKKERQIRNHGPGVQRGRSAHRGHK